MQLRVSGWKHRIVKFYTIFTFCKGLFGFSTDVFQKKHSSPGNPDTSPGWHLHTDANDSPYVSYTEKSLVNELSILYE